MSNPQPATKFLEHVEAIFGKEPVFFRGVEAKDGNASPAVMVFDNTPDTGYTTFVTYGLSYGTHESWVMKRKPELIMTLETDDHNWAMELADLVSSARSEFPFLYGNRISLGRKMNGTNSAHFLVYMPLVLAESEYLDIDIGLDYTICLNGIYPLTNGENEIIDMIGVQEFWNKPPLKLTTAQK